MKQIKKVLGEGLHKYTMIIALIALVIFFDIASGGKMITPSNFQNLLSGNAYVLILAIGMLMVIVVGHIDLSVGSVAGFCGMVMAIAFQTWNLPWWAAVLLALGIGLAFGLVQGFLISYLEIQPFIITLAGMFFARGMTTIVSVQPQKVAHEGFKALMKTKIEIPWLGYIAKKGNLIPARMEIGVVVALAVLVVVFIMLKKTRLGRGFYAIGGNSNSALMLGVNVKRTRFISYVISGLLSGIAGFVFMMHTGAGNATNAAGAEMNAIASSIIGGTLLSGGVGNVIGTFFGVLTLTTIKAIVTTSGLRDPWWQSITTGAMLCFFILLQSVVLSLRGKGGLKQMLPKWLTVRSKE